ncbi:TonB-dependent receptor domain-containing protein [Nitrosomonas sp.]|uniref:TonB-dependent receptor domain-containing protein n=1 Tax=Nitrosomonas sp. TaxID=42353 RepID=UPI001DA48088|nr:TonB-dependent receptor [Nitrosomonas sp.]MBX3617285.1 TonB-dependent receptor [Nitrosomonas sp.]
MTQRNKNNFKSLLSFFFLNLFIFFPHNCFAEIQVNVCTNQAFAQLTSIQGELWIDLAGTGEWQLVNQDHVICEGSRVKVGNNSRASIRLPNNILVRLDEGTVLTLKGITANQPTLLDLLKGFIHFLSRTPTRLEITTPIANAGPEGTEFAIKVDDQEALLWVYEGHVKFFNTQGSVNLSPGETAQALIGQAPHAKIDIKPIDAVQWALYYPTIIDTHVIEQQLPQVLQTNVRESLERYRQDKMFEALSLIKALDFEALTPQLLTYRAGLYLTFGRILEAKKDIDLALRLQPNNSAAYALQAIIAVVQNDKKAALQLAQQAVEVDRNSPTARLALSYAQQADFQIEEALSSVEETILLDGQNALAWARLSELQMSTGHLDRALESANQAVSLNPHLGKTQTILGFAHLLQIDTQAAKEIFHRAIALDQADPMPRLGLGLTLIREGELEAGRIELENAAGLDPANSLIRSYLGKAYFEEKRYPLASTQFDLAKERDPKDPTPWFYDAIQKQTQNRPVEALRDIQKSIELNNNRAVYRSKFLLDRDEAARGSSLARIFENLGFERRAVMEAAKSLSFDPTNHSAHRFLSDTYANTPRHEAARVSELLQAQLLQPININPVQPHLVVADLNIITGTGPSAAGFNEFTPLMERSKPQFVASGIAGSNSTLGNELVFSKFNERTSISLGQFHYETNGFRRNNDQNHDILNAFVQHALTTKLNIQAEVRTRSSDQGNLLQNFDKPSNNPRDAQNRIRRKIDDDAARLGAKYDLSTNQYIILSGQFNDKKFEDITNVVSLQHNLVNKRIKGYQTEIQYHFHNHLFSLIAGSGVFRTNFDQSSQIISAVNSNPIGNPVPSTGNHDKTNGYIYSNLNFVPNLNATVGFSYDSYHQTDFHTIDGFNPKFGIQWDILNNLRLRMAWIETIKAPLATYQTIEPIQIAGFNQLFDDLDGTKSRRMGIGLDAHYDSKIFSGFEISARDLSFPISSSNTSSTQKQKEELYSSYIYGILHKNWSAKSEARFEAISGFFEPHKIETLSIPTSINYFNPNGLFTSIAGTYVHQNIERNGVKNEKPEKFFLIDASIGYRFPNRKGIFSLEARNLFDENFLFQDINFHSSQTTVTRFVPSRIIFARVTLNF